MADTRELILERLVAIAESVKPDIKTVRRNSVSFKPDEQPACGVLDGDETKSRGQPIPAPMLPKQIMQMQFGLYLQAKDARPRNTPTGTQLNTIRAKLVKAVATDTELQALIGPNGALEYNGLSTDLRLGSELSGQMQLNFTCNYLFDPRA